MSECKLAPSGLNFFVSCSESPDSGELKIVRVDAYQGSASGGDEVFLLCEKVNKKDIKVRFFELDGEGSTTWQAFATFSESDVHHQVAIVFKTPAFRDQSICQPVAVWMQLFRSRDGECSESRPFTYLPRDVRKRRLIPHHGQHEDEIPAQGSSPL